MAGRSRFVADCTGSRQRCRAARRRDTPRAVADHLADPRGHRDAVRDRRRRRVVAVGSFDRSRPKSSATEGRRADRSGRRADSVAASGSRGGLRHPERPARPGSSAREIPVFVYSHAGLADVTVTIRTLGARVGRGSRPHDLAADIETRIAGSKPRVAGRRTAADPHRLRARVHARCGASMPAAASASSTTWSKPRAERTSSRT